MICLKLGKEVDGEDMSYVMDFMKKHDIHAEESAGNEFCIDEQSFRMLAVSLHDDIDDKLTMNRKITRDEEYEILKTLGFIVDVIDKKFK